MKNRFRWKHTILYWLAAAAVFLLLFLLWGKRAPGNQEENAVELLFMGDSIFGQERWDTSITELVNQQTGLRGINCAIGGTMLSRGRRDMDVPLSEIYITGEGEKLLGMSYLLEAVKWDDFGVQQSLHSWKNVLFYLPMVIDILDGIDFSRVETLVFNHGINDYHGNVPLDNPENPWDEYTFAGALRGTLQYLQDSYPEMRIIYVTPPYVWYPGRQETCETWICSENSLEEYVNLALDICNEYGVETVDIYHDFYEDHSMEGYSLYTEDGLHPNENGRRLIAEAISKCLENKE